MVVWRLTKYESLSFGEFFYLFLRFSLADTYACLFLEMLDGFIRIPYTGEIG